MNCFQQQRGGRLGRIAAVSLLLSLFILPVGVWADDDDKLNRIELVAAVDSVALDHIVVHGVRFALDSNTEADEDTDLQPGETVEVKGTYDPALGFYAREMDEASGDEPSIELRAMAGDFSGDSLHVAGLLFLVGDETRLEPAWMSHEDMAGGAAVEIHGYPIGESEFQARKVKFLGGAGKEVEVKGAITAVGDDSLVVAGVTFLVDSATVITRHHDGPFSMSDLSLGMVVEVDGHYTPGGAIVADRIDIEDRGNGDDDDEDDDRDHVKVEGLIDELGADYLVVLGSHFWVTADTRIHSEHHNPLVFSDLQIGMRVGVKAFHAAPDSLVAVKIKIENLEPREKVEVSGEVEALGDSTVTVSSLEFQVVAATRFVGPDSSAFGFADLAVGQFIEIYGVRDNSGNLIATRIKLKNRFAHEIEIEGAIDAISGDTVRVVGFDFLTDSTTIVRDEQKNRIALADLQVGLWVEVHARMLPDSSYFARRIDLKSSPGSSGGFSLAGTGQLLSTGEMRIGGATINVAPGTPITGVNGRSLGITELRSGLPLRLELTLSGGGTFDAASIQVERWTYVSGLLTMVSAEKLVVENAEMTLPASVLVLDSAGEPVGKHTLAQGQVVNVRAATSPSGTFATEIQIISSGGPTSVAGNQTSLSIPDGFALAQNHPNPVGLTSSGTVIHFEIDQGLAAQAVQLAVYNLLGQKVRSLLSAPASPGSHSVHWDGRDETGHVLPAGVYFYRLSVGNRNSVKKLIVVW